MRIKRNEFRKNNTKKYKGHPTYIYAQIGDEFLFVGITHSEITNGVKNIKLDKNPNPKDKKNAYFRPFTDKMGKSSFGKKLKGWTISENDKNKIKK